MRGDHELSSNLIFGLFLPILSPRFFPPDAKDPSAEAALLQAEVRRRLSSSLSSTFKIPETFWTPVAQEASGFFGCQDREDADGLQRYSMYDKLIRTKMMLMR